MAEPPQDPPETPMQRALRLKQAAQQSRPRPPGEPVLKAKKGVSAGASRPWMKK